MTGFALAVAWSLWLGILTSIHPCPLATNVVAISYLARRLGDSRQVFWSGVLYTIGRSATYVIIGMVLVGGLLSSPTVSTFLQKQMSRIEGPLLVLVGMLLLGLFRVSFQPLGVSPQIQQRADRWGIWGAGLLGVVFALTLCPISATYLFLELDLSVRYASKIVMPSAFGIGTALPVIAFALLVAASARSVGKSFEQVRRFEWWARQTTGILFVLVGIYYSLKCIFEVLR
jgi:cytochrome c biogenesis protein CcdA